MTKCATYSVELAFLVDVDSQWASSNGRQQQLLVLQILQDDPLAHDNVIFQYGEKQLRIRPHVFH